MFSKLLQKAIQMLEQIFDDIHLDEIYRNSQAFSASENYTLCLRLEQENTESQLNSQLFLCFHYHLIFIRVMV